MRKKKKHLDRKSVIEAIDKCPAECFDGHTDFARLTPGQRLLWLSSMNYFPYKIARANPGLGCAALFQKHK